ASTGALSFILAPDFEAPADVGADNVHEVTLQVSDGNGGTDSITLSITVTDVNEAPTALDLSGNTIDENTDTSGGVSIGTLSATDPETGESFTYSIVGGADAAVFAIGGAGSDELVISAGVLDFETKASFEV